MFTAFCSSGCEIKRVRVGALRCAASRERELLFFVWFVLLLILII
jgi:hypothetical protein